MIVSSQQSEEIGLCFGPEVGGLQYVYRCWDAAVINKTGSSDGTTRTPSMHKAECDPLRKLLGMCS
jgi:hypothetical protein